MSKISNGRKALYYIGMGTVILGFILFISTFFFVASFMSQPYMGKEPSFMNSIVGMVLLIVGSIIMSIGGRGAAGSGVLLDPEKAREDLKPFNEAKGGMINDVISNIDAVDSILKPKVNKEVVKIRCRSCKSLNDEDSNFCKNCGSQL